MALRAPPAKACERAASQGVPLAVGVSTVQQRLSNLSAAGGVVGLPWLHHVKQPTLVVAGDDDPSVPVLNARMLAARLPDARLHVIKGGGHLSLLDEPQSAVGQILGFPDERM